MNLVYNTNPVHKCDNCYNKYNYLYTIDGLNDTSELYLCYRCLKDYQDGDELTAVEGTY